MKKMLAVVLSLVTVFVLGTAVVFAAKHHNSAQVTTIADIKANGWDEQRVLVDGELTEVGVDDDRLRIRIADDTDSGISHKLVESRLELRTKIRTFQIVNRTCETGFLIVCSHTAAPGSQMRIIVGAIE